VRPAGRGNPVPYRITFTPRLHKPRIKSGSLPTYRLYKRTGQAVVTLDGRDHYLGPHGSPESHEAYQRLIAEWLQRGRAAPPRACEAPPLSVNELILAYWRHAEAYYRDSPSALEKVRLSVRPLRRLYGRTPAADFRPLALQAVRDDLAARLARRTVNMRLGVIKRLFRWAAGQELVPPAIYEGLRAVEGLREGRSAARESRRVRPVTEEQVGRTLPLVSSHVRGLIELQWLTGARSGELCTLRPCDIDRSGPVWVYRPRHHKNDHRGQGRLIFLGPKAQSVLRPFLGIPPDAYVFSPRRSMEDRYAALRQARRSTVPPSQRDRRKSDPRRRPGEHYTVRSYYKAVRSACRRGGIPPWHPHQLRHAAATRLRQEYGVEAARVILGHASAATTEIYAELDRQAAVRVMAAVG
jgi:integrase